MNPLDVELRQILAELSVVSAGRIYSYEPIGSKGGFSSSQPKTGDANPPHLLYAQMYRVEQTDEGRRRIITEARAELSSLRKRTVPEGFTERPEPPVERARRLLRDGEGIPLQEAAFRLNCAPSELLRLRKADNRDGREGRPIPDVSGLPRERARALRDASVSTREIARRLGVHQTQVMRWLRG